MSQQESSSPHVKAATIGGIFALAAAIISGIFLLANTLLEKSATSPSLPVTPVQVTNTKIVEIDSRQGWQVTGISVERGTALIFKVIEGQWTTQKGVTPYNSGEGSDYVCANLIPASRCVEPVPDYPSGALVGQIGSQILRVSRGSTVITEQSGGS